VTTDVKANIDAIINIVPQCGNSGAMENILSPVYVYTNT
jgi:hypothetical protein